MNKFKYGLALILGLCYTSPSFADEPVSPIVKIEFPNGHGTGFYVGHGMYVTAAHVVSHGSDAEIKILHSDGSEAVHNLVLIADYVHDYAIVYSDDSVESLPLGLACNTPVKVGDDIKDVGFPFDFPKVQTVFGRVSSLHNKAGTTPDVTIVNMGLSPGMSGGPAFNSDDNVIGIGTIYYEGSSFSAFVPIQWICQLQLSEAK